MEVPGLYEAEVPVSGQSTAERIAASRTALAEVLIKASGNADVAQLPQIESLLSQAGHWVQSYQYRAAPPPVVGAPTVDAANAVGLSSIFMQYPISSLLCPLTSLQFFQPLSPFGRRHARTSTLGIQEVL